MITPDLMTEEEWLASVEATALEDEPWWLGEEEECDPGPAPEDRDQPEPGEPARRAAPFASGSLLDDAPGCPVLAAFADDAAGPGDRFAGASDDELLGVLRAWGRVESHAAARKYAAIAELARRRPPAAPQDAARWDEFAASELAGVLAESRADAVGMLALAYDFKAKLPATWAALRDGTITLDKAEIIAHATAVLDDDEARRAEAMVLGRAGQLTPEGLRSATARAVIAVNPEKARKRREQGARQARVERWAEPSGNAGLAGRELPPAAVLAADQKVSATAAPGRGPGTPASTTGNARVPGRPAGPPRPGSPSPPPVSTGRPARTATAGTAPGGSPPGHPASAT